MPSARSHKSVPGLEHVTGLGLFDLDIADAVQTRGKGTGECGGHMLGDNDTRREIRRKRGTRIF